MSRDFNGEGGATRRLCSLQDAAIRNFEIVGEAAKRVSQAFKAQHAEIPWADLAGFRDVLIHQ